MSSSPGPLVCWSMLVALVTASCGPVVEVPPAADGSTGAHDSTSTASTASTALDTSGTSTDSGPLDSTGPDDTSGTTGSSSGTNDGTSETTGATLPDTPTLELSFSPVKQLDFGWSVPGAETFQLLESVAPGEPWVQLGGDQADESAQQAGAAYVLVRDAADQWSQQAYIKASNTDAGDYFGIEVAVSDDGNTLAVGATGEASTATGIDGDQLDDSATFAGAVYVFVRDATDT